MDPDIFYPNAEGEERAAFAICAPCPHTGRDGPCFAEGVRFGENEGIRGGVQFGRGHHKRGAKRKCRGCREPLVEPYLERGDLAWCNGDCLRAWHAAQSATMTG